MKRDPLITELTDWIEKLDSPNWSVHQWSRDLQHVLLRCRRELIRKPVDNQSQTEQEKQTELQKQVQAEMAKQKAKLGIK